MPTNTRTEYVTIGWEYANHQFIGVSIDLPAPIEVPSSNEFMVDATRSATGALIAEQIGRTQYTTELRWLKFPANLYWKINRCFDTYGYFFYMRYFSHSDGRVKVHRFYRGNAGKATPSEEQEKKTIGGTSISVPKYYRDVSFSIIDMGEPDPIIELEVPVS